MPQPSSPYVFRPGKNIRSEFVRLLGVLSGEASHLVPSQPQALAKSVHRARTLIKRTRSLRWFIRPLLGPSASVRLKTRLRKAAQFLAISRDQIVIQSTLKKLARNSSNSRDRKTLAHFAQILTQKPIESVPPRKSIPDPLLKAVQFLLLALEEMGTIAKTSHRPWPFPSERLTKAFHSAHKAEKKARRIRTVFRFHQWRKKVKRLLHLLELIHGQSDNPTLHAIRQVDRLQEKLGTYHDCAVVQDHLRKEHPAPPEAAHIHQLLEKRKKHLRKKTQRLALLISFKLPPS